VKLLLRNGAHLDEMSCRSIYLDTLESYFDSCIEIDDGFRPDSARLVPVTFDYSFFLTTPTKTKSEAGEISSIPAKNRTPVDDDLENDATEMMSYTIQAPQQGKTY